MRDLNSSEFYPRTNAERFLYSLLCFDCHRKLREEAHDISSASSLYMKCWDVAGNGVNRHPYFPSEATSQPRECEPAAQEPAEAVHR